MINAFARDDGLPKWLLTSYINSQGVPLGSGTSLSSGWPCAFQHFQIKMTGCFAASLKLVEWHWGTRGRLIKMQSFIVLPVDVPRQGHKKKGSAPDHLLPSATKLASCKDQCPDLRACASQLSFLLPMSYAKHHIQRLHKKWP